MPDEQAFRETFQALRPILAQYEPHLVKVHDSEESYYLDTAHVMKNEKPLFFGAVTRGKRYVSFHLMPVYLWPELLEPRSKELRGRMQGKSCFNFTRPDPALLAELAGLVEEGFERYRREGYVG
jgi:hypothetical protein